MHFCGRGGLFESECKKFTSRSPALGHCRREQGPSYKHQAASCKRQAASLTRDLYCVIGYYKLKRKKYESKIEALKITDSFTRDHLVRCLA